jgi:hypothetical protein
MDRSGATGQAVWDVGPDRLDAELVDSNSA